MPPPVRGRGACPAVLAVLSPVGKYPKDAREGDFTVAQALDAGYRYLLCGPPTNRRVAPWESFPLPVRCRSDCRTGKGPCSPMPAPGQSVGDGAPGSSCPTRFSVGAAYMPPVPRPTRARADTEVGPYGHRCISLRRGGPPRPPASLVPAPLLRVAGKARPQPQIRLPRPAQFSPGDSRARMAGMKWRNSPPDTSAAMASHSGSAQKAAPAA